MTQTPPDSTDLDGTYYSDAAQTPAHLEDLAQWADAAVGLFPVHGERFQEIARVLRAGAAQPPTAEQVEDACAAYAKATGYYIEFHRGLSSESSDLMRVGMRAALCAVLRHGASSDAS